MYKNNALPIYDFYLFIFFTQAWKPPTLRFVLYLLHSHVSWPPSEDYTFTDLVEYKDDILLSWHII
jgi:hypothetical protein